MRILNHCALVLSHCLKQSFLALMSNSWFQGYIRINEFLRWEFGCQITVALGWPITKRCQKTLKNQSISWLLPYGPSLPRNGILSLFFSNRGQHNLVNEVNGPFLGILWFLKVEMIIRVKNVFQPIFNSFESDHLLPTYIFYQNYNLAIFYLFWLQKLLRILST